MKTITLAEVLTTQDMGVKGINTITDSVMDNSFDANKDPLTAIIVKTFIENDYSDYDSVVTDLSYSINQLQRAKKFIEEMTTED